MTRPYERLAGRLAIGVAIGGLAYSVAFVIALKAPSESALAVSNVLLLIGGLLATAVLVGLYLRLREVDPGLAMLGLVIGAVGSLGSAIHGAYDIAVYLHPVEGITGGLPNAIDPRGLLTFGFTGLGVLVLARVIGGASGLPGGLASLGTALGIAMILVYLGRLIILDPNHPALLGLAAVTGVALHPAFFVWLGRSLLREPAA